jgi:hypothetical protein
MLSLRALDKLVDEFFAYQDYGVIPRLGREADVITEAKALMTFIKDTKHSDTEKIGMIIIWISANKDNESQEEIKLNAFEFLQKVNQKLELTT